MNHDNYDRAMLRALESIADSLEKIAGDKSSLDMFLKEMRELKEQQKDEK